MHGKCLLWLQLSRFLTNTNAAASVILLGLILSWMLSANTDEAAAAFQARMGLLQWAGGGAMNTSIA